MLRGPVFELLDFMRGQADIIEVVIAFFCTAVIIFVVFPIHECAHGVMAKILGDDTAEREGRLTLNPLAHIDPMGALFMCLCNIGWAKPTPVTLYRCIKVKQRTALALVSFAGPLANILLAYIFVIIGKIVLLVAANGSGDILTMTYIIIAINYVAQLNIFLAVFNLLPIPPFDGSKILYSFLPQKGAQFMDRYGQIIHWVFFALLIFDVLDEPLGYLSSGAMWLLDKASFFIPAPFM